MYKFPTKKVLYAMLDAPKTKLDTLYGTIKDNLTKIINLKPSFSSKDSSALNTGLEESVYLTKSRMR